MSKPDPLPLCEEPTPAPHATLTLRDRAGGILPPTQMTTGPIQGTQCPAGAQAATKPPVEAAGPSRSHLKHAALRCPESSAANVQEQQLGK